jgi:hypothetical protein
MGAVVGIDNDSVDGDGKENVDGTGDEKELALLAP